MSDGISTFTSYTDQAEKESVKHKIASKALEKSYELLDEEVNKVLLPGEVAVGHAIKVIKYNAHDDTARGVSGNLVCTNFRLLFITKEQSAFAVNQLKNRLIGSQDIPLNSIDTIYVEYPSKRKRLYPGSNLKDGIRRLEVYCKDFKVVAFNFKFTIKSAEKTFINTLLHHAYPTNVSLLFPLEYKHDMNVQDAYTASGTPTYRTYKDWEDLLRAHRLEGRWRVTSVNQTFTTSDTMGEHFIIPNSELITDNKLEKASNQFNNRRLPAWCWTSPNGCSLVRSAEMRNESEFVDMEKEFHKEIEAADHALRPLKVFEIGKLCPSCSQIQQSFSKVKNLCIPGSEDEFYEKDSSWLSLLQTTKWLHHVSSCLSVACDAVQWINKKEHTVIIREPSGVDVTPVITCLVQIMADPKCRTIVGFQSLIQREWVIGGFPFLDRLGHLLQPSKSKPNNVKPTEGETSSKASPVFLLFLDCVWQLLQQHPTSFEFTSTFLTCLYDGTRTLLFDTFLFNNERHRWRLIRSSRETSPDVDPLPIWNWSHQYDNHSRKLFINPLYRLHTSRLADSYTPSMPPSPTNKSKVFTIPVSLSVSVDSLNIIDENPSPIYPSSPVDEDAPSLSIERTHSDPMASEELQVRYNNETGVLTINGATNSYEGEKKKRTRFSSFRRKKIGGKVSNNPEPKPSSNTDVPANFIQTTMLQETKHRRKVFRKGSILKPLCGVANLTFWASCHLRWSSWSQLLGGGPAAIYQQESIIYDEIHALNNRVLELENQRNNVACNGVNEFISENSGMYFQHHSSSVSSERIHGEKPDQSPMFISNYFPYSPVKDDGRKLLDSRSILSSPMPSLFRSSSLFNLKFRGRHSRSASDVPIAPPCVDEITPIASTGGVNASSSSLNSLIEENEKKTSSEVSRQPKKPPPPVPPPPSLKPQFSNESLPYPKRNPSALSLKSSPPKPPPQSLKPSPPKKPPPSQKPSPPKVPPQSLKPRDSKKALMPPSKPLVASKEHISYETSL